MTTSLPLVVILSGVALSGIAVAGCFPVTGNRILGSDLALADTQFSALPSNLTLGYAPAPGTKRIYSAAELQLLGRANGIPLTNPAGICFEVPMQQIKEEDVVAAMRRALPANASLKIVELAKADVPAGQLEFPVEGLEPSIPSAPGTQLWRGYVKYAETRKAAYWARVDVTSSFTAVVATKDLPLNKAIDAASLRIETRTGPLDREQSAARIEDVIGRVPRRALKAGAPIPLALLVDPPEVHRGDPVKVEVQSGPAHLQFEAIAENSANEGEMIELRNPSSGKTFRAKLSPGSKVIVIIAPGQSL
jgi:flagellar basal body P-ring formation protein FlgA